MDITTAKRIQKDCLDQMKKGGLSPMGRHECFAKFETTKPDTKLVEEFYDVWAKDYNVDLDEVDYTNPNDVASEMERLFPTHRDAVQILDVGAGTGKCGKLLFDAGFTDIDATDGSPGMLEEAKRLGVYKHLFREVLVKGKKMTTILPETYDVITSSGSFYPFHLQGYHLLCFLDCVKTGGLLVISSCPSNDEKVALKPIIRNLENDGIVKVEKEVYIPNWYMKDDGTLFVLKKLQPLSKQ